MPTTLLLIIRSPLFKINDSYSHGPSTRHQTSSRCYPCHFRYYRTGDLRARRDECERFFPFSYMVLQLTTCFRPYFTPCKSRYALLASPLPFTHSELSSAHSLSSSSWPLPLLGSGSLTRSQPTSPAKWQPMQCSGFSGSVSSSTIHIPQRPGLNRQSARVMGL